MRPQGWKAWLTHDYFPGAERLLRRLVYNRLGALLTAAVISLLCGLFLHPHALVCFWGLLSLIILGLVWPWLGLRGISASLSFSRLRVREGEAVQASLQLTNQMPWAAWGIALRGGFGSADPSNGLTSIHVAPGRQTLIHRWSLLAPRRGVYPGPDRCLSTGFPFGLYEATRGIQAGQPLLVWPQTYPVGPVPSFFGEHLLEGSVSRNKVGSEGDPVGARPYRRGDSPRRIHWAQSARHDRLIVCELHSYARPSVHLILNTDPKLYSNDTTMREWAIRAFASLAEGWLNDGVPVGATIDRQCFPASGGRGQVQRILDALAQIDSATEVTLLEQLTTLAAPGGSSLQVVVASDAACARLPAELRLSEERQFLLLRGSGFIPGAEATEVPAANILATLDSPDTMLQQLRYGWKEAVHG